MRRTAAKFSLTGAGTNSLSSTRMSNVSDVDGRGSQTPKNRGRGGGERVSFDSSSGSGSLPTMESVS